MKTSTTDCSRFVKICKAFLFTLLLSAGMLASANAQTLTSNQFGYAPVKQFTFRNWFPGK
jgi:hypothetical protein